MARRGPAGRASRADALSEQVHSVNRAGERRRDRGAREGPQGQSSSKHPEEHSERRVRLAAVDGGVDLDCRVGAGLADGQSGAALILRRGSSVHT